MTVTTISPRQALRPYFLLAIDQLPESLLELAKSHLPAMEGSQAIEGIFVVPPETHKHGSRWSLNPLQAIIFTKQGVLHVTSAKGGRPGEGVWVSAGDIFMIRLSMILLYEKLEIFGVENEQIKKIEVEYHVGGHALLITDLRGLIRKTWQKNPPTLAHTPRDTTFSSFESTSYSFYNGLKDEAIQPDERVVGYVYQPEIQIPRLKIFTRKVFPQTVAALTDQQLILLQQDLALKTHHEWIFTFIPLYRIESIKQGEYKNWQKLSIHLLCGPQQQDIDVILELAPAQKWNSILQALQGGNLTGVTQGVTG